MRMHHRYQECEAQKQTVRLIFLRALEQTDLTYIEIVILLTEILEGLNKHALREERNPEEPHKPADAE